MKITQWKYGLVVALALGLPGCYMGFFEDPGVDYAAHKQVPKDQASFNRPSQGQMTAEAATQDGSQPVQKTYATKDPTQKSTPGPKQTAAPQLPVIQ